MPALHFQKRFMTAVLDGTKQSTIRAERKDKRKPAETGENLSLYTGMRTKSCKKIKDCEVTNVKRFMITRHRENDSFDYIGYLDGLPLSEKEFHQLAIADGFENAQGLIEYVNPGFEKLTGYTSEEVMGRKPGEFLQGPETSAETRAKIRQQLHAGAPFYDEILNYTKSGEPYWISMSINPVRNDAGELVRFISVQANITDVKLKAKEFETRMAAITESNVVLEWAADGALTQGNDKLNQVMERIGLKDRKTMSLDALFTSEQVEQMKRGQTVTDEIMVKGERDTAWLSGAVQVLLGFVRFLY